MATRRSTATLRASTSPRKTSIGRRRRSRVCSSSRCSTCELHIVTCVTSSRCSTRELPTHAPFGAPPCAPQRPHPHVCLLAGARWSSLASSRDGSRCFSRSRWPSQTSTCIRSGAHTRASRIVTGCSIFCQPLFVPNRHQPSRYRMLHLLPTLICPERQPTFLLQDAPFSSNLTCPSPARQDVHLLDEDVHDGGRRGHGGLRGRRLHHGRPPALLLLPGAAATFRSISATFITALFLRRVACPSPTFFLPSFPLSPLLVLPLLPSAVPSLFHLAPHSPRRARPSDDVDVTFRYTSVTFPSPPAVTPLPQTMSTVGALLLLVVHGPGKLSIDEQHGPMQLITTKGDA